MAASIASKFSLKGRNYVVTGGAMGIGYSITKDIADAGGNVAVIDLRDTPLEDVYGLAKQYGVKTDYFQADVSNEAQLTSAFEKAVQSLGTVDGIVTAAGIAIDKPFVDQKWEEVEKVLQVNTLGSMFAAQLAVKQMQKQGTPGSVVFIASITAHVNLPGFRMAGYNCSKGAVKMLSQVLSAELAPKGIRVNSISPAFIETNQTRGAREHTTQACGDLMQTAPPMGRIGQPDEVSPAAIFFLSDAAAYVTGADILYGVSCYCAITSSRIMLIIGYRAYFEGKVLIPVSPSSSSSIDGASDFTNMEDFDWNREWDVLRGPFSFFDDTMVFESLDVDANEATALLRITYTGNDPLLKKGRGHPLVPPLHLHFKQTETFKVLQGEMAVVRGWDEEEFILRPENTPFDVKAWEPHTPYCYGGDEDTIVLIRAHPPADDDPLGAVFFEHLFRLLDEAHRAKMAPDLVQVMVMQHATDSALIMFPSVRLLGSLRWRIPWLLQGAIAYVGGLLGYTPEIKRFMHVD